LTVDLRRRRIKKNGNGGVVWGGNDVEERREGKGAESLLEQMLGLFLADPARCLHC
jgi:hypothetical protein